MPDQGYTASLNDVIQDPKNRALVESLMIKTATNCYPGALVIRDTTDNQVQVAGAAGAYLGWLGYERCAAPFKPINRDTVYAADAEAPVHSGGGFRVRAILATSQTIVKGDFLVGVANGQVAKAAAITITASGAANITTGQGVNGTYGSAGPIVCQADESVTTTGATAAIWIKSLI